MNTMVIEYKEMPIRLDDVKLFLRVDTDEENTLISTLLAAAISEAESITHRHLVQKVVRYVTDDVSTIPLAPCSAVSMTVDGQPVDSSLYAFLPSSMLGGEPFATCTVKEGFPSGSITVDATVGYSEIEFPSMIHQWVLGRVSSLYEQRESFATGTNFHEFGHDFLDALLDPFIIHGGF